MKVKLIITVDVNNWDYVTKEIDDVEEEHLQSIKELLSKFLWSDVIDIRDKGNIEIMNQILTKDEQEQLLLLLYGNSPLYSHMKDWWISYNDLFSRWLYWNDKPHTLISVEVIRDSFTLL